MKSFLNTIRCEGKPISVGRQMIDTMCVLFLGIALGTISKMLDHTPGSDLPFIFEYCCVYFYLQ